MLSCRSQHATASGRRCALSASRCWSRKPIRLYPQPAADDLPLDLRGARVDLARARVAQVPFDAARLEVAGRAVDLQGVVAVAHERLAQVELDVGRLAGQAAADG